MYSQQISDIVFKSEFSPSLERLFSLWSHT